MSMPTVLCHCSAELPPIGWSDHQHRYHDSKPGYACADCDFTSQSFPDTVGHASLEGHCLDGVKFSSCSNLLTRTAILLGGNPSAHRSATAEQAFGPLNLELKMEEVEDPVGSEEDDTNNAPPAENLRTKATPDATFVLKFDGVDSGSKTCLTKEAPEDSEKIEKEEKGLVPADNAHLDPKEPELSEEEEPEEEISPVEPMPLKQTLAEGLLPRRVEEKTPKMLKANNVLDLESPQAILCSKCGTAVKWRSMGKYSAAAQHVHSCLSIRPFACSNCGHGGSQAGNVRMHIQRQCPGAKVEMVEMEKCQSELREGLQRCFPEENFAIRDK